MSQNIKPSELTDFQPFLEMLEGYGINVHHNTKSHAVKVWCEPAVIVHHSSLGDDESETTNDLEGVGTSLETALDDMMNEIHSAASVKCGEKEIEPSDLLLSSSIEVEPDYNPVAKAMPNYEPNYYMDEDDFSLPNLFCCWALGILFLGGVVWGIWRMFV